MGRNLCHAFLSTAEATTNVRGVRLISIIVAPRRRHPHGPESNPIYEAQATPLNRKMDWFLREMPLIKLFNFLGAEASRERHLQLQVE